MVRVLAIDPNKDEPREQVVEVPFSTEDRLSVEDIAQALDEKVETMSEWFIWKDESLSPLPPHLSGSDLGNGLRLLFPTLPVRGESDLWCVTLTEASRHDSDPKVEAANSSWRLCCGEPRETCHSL